MPQVERSLPCESAFVRTCIGRRMTGALVVAALLGACGDSGGAADTADTRTSTSSEAHLSGMTAGSIDTAALGAPYLGPLTFSWPADCEVDVAESVLRKDVRAELSYKLGLVAEGDHIVVSYRDMEVLEVAGRSLSDKERRDAAVPFLLPEMVVDAAGEVIEVRGMDALIDQIADLDPSLRDVASSPTFAQTIESSAISKYWNVWAGGWAMWGSFEETEEEGYYEAADGSAPGSPDFTMYSLGTTESARAVLRREEILAGPQLAEALGVVMGSLGEDLGKPPDTDAFAGFDGERVTTTEVVTDPATLRPDSTHLRIDLEATFEGETQSVVEERTAVFDWSSSTCAAAKPSAPAP